jgi:hypothetical protein
VEDSLRKQKALKACSDLLATTKAEVDGISCGAERDPNQPDGEPARKYEAE